MENRFFVDYKVHNKENGGWAYKTELNTDDYDKALVKFHDVCKTYVGGNTFDHALIILSDAFGNNLKTEDWTKVEEVVEVPTEPTAEDIINKLIEDGKIAQEDVDNAKAELEDTAK